MNVTIDTKKLCEAIHLDEYLKKSDIKDAGMNILNQITEMLNKNGICKNENKEVNLYNTTYDMPQAEYIKHSENKYGIKDQLILKLYDHNDNLVILLDTIVDSNLEFSNGKFRLTIGSEVIDAPLLSNIIENPNYTYGMKGFIYFRNLKQEDVKFNIDAIYAKVVDMKLPMDFNKVTKTQIIFELDGLGLNKSDK